MKAFLMYKDQDFNLSANLPANASDLTQDLELHTLFNAMADEDKFLFNVVNTAVLLSLTDADSIKYRQQILTDCLQHPDVVKDIYGIALAAINGEKSAWRFMLNSADSVLHSSIQLLEIFLPLLKKLRQVAELHAAEFHSEGFARFFKMITEELDDAYLNVVQDHLTQLTFPNGALISAKLGKGNKGTDYTLRKPFAEEKRSLVSRLLKRNKPLYFEIADRDESGIRSIAELRERGINAVADALSQSADHILDFFIMLRNELAFYIGCLNLHERLVRKGEPTCTPTLATDSPVFSAKELYDVCLSLRLETKVVGNTIAADNKELIIVTGANQGGKSTFLRSVGLAYLMMQSGMFVAADYFSANVSKGIFTHFKREEDVTMKSGKLDEELGRMSRLVDQIKPNCIMLFNESFASTNEREGSEIARQITSALLDSGIEVFFVTHLFDLAHSFYQQHLGFAFFLRAERLPDGKRTFKIVEGEPLPTSYGEDLYKQIFSDRTQQPTKSYSLQ